MASELAATLIKEEIMNALDNNNCAPSSLQAFGFPLSRPVDDGPPEGGIAVADVLDVADIHTTSSSEDEDEDEECNVIHSLSRKQSKLYETIAKFGLEGEQLISDGDDTNWPDSATSEILSVTTTVCRKYSQDTLVADSEIGRDILKVTEKLDRIQQLYEEVRTELKDIQKALEMITISKKEVEIIGMEKSD